MPPIHSETLRSSARVAGRSSGTCTEIFVSFSLGRSITHSQPPFSNTIASEPTLGHFTSYSVKFVTLRCVFLSRSYAHTFAIFDSRSEQ